MYYFIYNIYVISKVSYKIAFLMMNVD